MAGRPKLPKVDPEMQRWCALIEEEMSAWPDITTRPMFGLNAYYRSGAIFAAIPCTRAVGTPFSFLLKLPSAAPRSVAGVPGKGWVTLEMESEADISTALRQLGRAYEAAQVRRTKKRAERTRR
jgi:hypothetical protein